MKKALDESIEKVTLVAIGPYTNVTNLFTTYPECKEKIEEIVLMGGSSGRGNITQAAEFNIYIDPDAAKIVFESGLPITVLPLDVTNKAKLDEQTINKIKSLNKVGDMFYYMFSNSEFHDMKDGLDMHELTTIAYLDEPELFKSNEAFVDIEVKGEYTSGFMIVDYNGKYNKPKMLNFTIM